MGVCIHIGTLRGWRKRQLSIDLYLTALRQCLLPDQKLSFLAGLTGEANTVVFLPLTPIAKLGLEAHAALLSFLMWVMEI